MAGCFLNPSTPNANSGRAGTKYCEEVCIFSSLICSFCVCYMSHSPSLGWYLLSIQFSFFPSNHFCWTAIWAAFQCACFWSAVFCYIIWLEDKFHLSLLSVYKSLSWYFTKLSSISLPCGFPQESQIQSPFTCHATVYFFPSAFSQGLCWTLRVTAFLSTSICTVCGNAYLHFSNAVGYSVFTLKLEPQF